MIFATSSGVPSRCSGICCSTIFSVPGDRIEVSISPGAMALTRTPCAALQPLADFRDSARGVRVVGEIDLDVILGTGVPRAVFRERMPRTGKHAPAGAREADHGRMADAAAGAGQKQRAPWCVGG